MPEYPEGGFQASKPGLTEGLALLSSWIADHEARKRGGSAGNVMQAMELIRARRAGEIEAQQKDYEYRTERARAGQRMEAEERERQDRATDRARVGTPGPVPGSYWTGPNSIDLPPDATSESKEKLTALQIAEQEWKNSPEYRKALLDSINRRNTSEGGSKNDPGSRSVDELTSDKLRLQQQLISLASKMTDFMGQPVPEAMEQYRAVKSELDAVESALLAKTSRFTKVEDDGEMDPETLNLLESTILNTRK